MPCIYKTGKDKYCGKGKSYNPYCSKHKDDYEEIADIVLGFFGKEYTGDQGPLTSTVNKLIERFGGNTEKIYESIKLVKEVLDTAKLEQDLEESEPEEDANEEIVDTEINEALPEPEITETPTDHETPEIDPTDLPTNINREGDDDLHNDTSAEVSKKQLDNTKNTPAPQTEGQIISLLKDLSN